MFFGGAVQGVATMTWWLVDLMGRYGAFYAPVAWTVPPIWAHAYLMVYGFFPFFIFGFLFTTYPNWMNGERIPPASYISAFLLMAGGVVLYYIGLAAAKWILITGTILLLAGWGVALHALLRVLFFAPHQEKRHPIAISAALVLGWLGSAAYAAWLLTENAWLLDFARTGGIWFFLLPIFITVSHRMIPFFSGSVLKNYVMVRPFRLLWLMLALTAGHGVMQLAESYRYLWLADLPLFLCALYLSYKWGFLRSFEIRILAMLHIAFAWLAAALLLYTAQSLLLFANELHLFGLSPLHALTVGLFASMVLAMASRVTLGHSGNPLIADSATWFLFLGFQTVAVSRILADLLTERGIPGNMLYLAAAAIWLAAFIPWAIKFVPVYWRPRADGRPG